MKHIPVRTRQAFTLTEVLISIAIALLFVASTMQAMLYGLTSTSQTRRNSDQVNLIQADAEAMKQQASALGVGSLISLSTAGGVATLTVDSTVGFNVNDLILIGNDPTTYDITQVDSVNKLLTLRTLLNSSPSTGAMITSVTACNATAATGSFATRLQQLVGATTSSSVYISGKAFTLTRTTTVPATTADAPYYTLKMFYSLTPAG
ncbi:MAG: prepilin-type N-terminal cleavage/methylation domain-containing protein, partial [Gemmatimonadaceae bacterium]|nr:prepilin-type N-terminal cleavage/methylation domain-containing protein [Gloeobacterales cyanobacterium ES-bin-141]